MASSSMKFSTFQAEYQDDELRTVIEQLVDTTEIGLTPDQRTDFKQKLRRYVDVQGDFDFGRIPNGVRTLEQVHTRIAAITGNVHMSKLLYSHGPETWYNNKMFEPNADGQFLTENGAQWVLVTQNKSEPETEIECIVWLDRRDQVVDWKLTLKNFNDHLRLRLCYNDNTLKKTIVHFANFFEGLSPELFEGNETTPNDVANYLINMQKPLDKSMYYRTQLYAVNREPNDTMLKAMQTAKILIDRIHPADQAERRNRMKITALLAFTPDELVQDVNKQIKDVLQSQAPLNIDKFVDVVQKVEK